MRALLRLAILLAAVFPVSCRNNESLPVITSTGGPKPPVDSGSEPGPISGNLLTLSRGAVIVWRSGEFSLLRSAMSAIDDSRVTYWTSPPADLVQRLVVALPTKTRVNAVGLSHGLAAPLPRAASRLQFESSLDGKSFTPLGEVRPEKLSQSFVIAVRPTEAAYLRVTLMDNFGPLFDVDVAEIEARGEALAPLAPRSLRGRWKLNQYMADFEQEGALVRGLVHSETPTFIEGGWEGNALRYAWTRGKEYGLGIISVDPSSRNLNAMWWYEHADPFHLGGCWFGQKTDDPSAAVPDMAIQSAFRDRSMSYPLYGIVFDSSARLDVQQSERTLQDLVSKVTANPGEKPTLLVRDFQGPDQKTNQADSDRRRDALAAELERRGLAPGRVPIISLGNTSSRSIPSTGPERSVYTRVELEIPLPGKKVERLP